MLNRLPVLPENLPVSRNKPPIISFTAMTFRRSSQKGLFAAFCYVDFRPRQPSREVFIDREGAKREPLLIPSRLLRRDCPSGRGPRRHLNRSRRDKSVHHSTINRGDPAMEDSRDRDPRSHGRGGGADLSRRAGQDIRATDRHRGSPRFDNVAYLVAARSISEAGYLFTAANISVTYSQLTR